ncbi:hypothetical protein [Maridesulfovibrio ferrireducens]|uniref:hypothetical protein n=1 Tax=Maridesulfovibrio ferrireducens TaxID=246191 RepID=UPI001A237582|nr:hypothetical protein [Maridesulfovibrio ferrireducens]MBI9110344.1 hypothetical protein [Maridesulfovibrio ferrireducens]
MSSSEAKTEFESTVKIVLMELINKYQDCTVDEYLEVAGKVVEQLKRMGEEE